MLCSRVSLLAVLLACGHAAVSSVREGVWIATSETVEDGALMEAVRLQLAPAAPAALGDTFVRVSDPQSDRYRQYVSTEEIKELVRPAEGAREAVHAWAAANVPSARVEQSLHGDAVLLRGGAAGEVAAAFGVDLSWWRHTTAVVSQQIRTSPSARQNGVAAVPPSLRRHVTSVLGLADLLPVPHHPSTPFHRSPVEGRRGSDGDASPWGCCCCGGDILPTPACPAPPACQQSTFCNQSFGKCRMPPSDAVGGEPGEMVTPPVIYSQYNVTDADVGKGGGRSQGVAAFEDAQFLPSDVAGFQKAFDLPPVKLGVQGPNDGGYFGEAGLDTQYITASGRNIPTWFLSQQVFDMLSFCELVMNMTDKERPSVVSISWGSGEANYDTSHMQAANTCFQKMGAAGISVFVASGDKGTGHAGLFRCKTFDPDWPATSPYVTSVGGTSTQGGVEAGWDGSGGGFSNVFDAPSYQNASVAAYLKAESDSLPAPSFYHVGGRALPDVAALATNFEVYSGELQPSGTLTGTSAAAPVFAGLVSLINDELAAAGKPPVGFANPALYAAGAGGFGVDITTGDNCASGCKKGFVGSKGWDPVTGLGTPSLPLLRKVLA